jgi:hypothetical protein
MDALGLFRASDDEGVDASARPTTEGVDATASSAG